ncbi:hypothetical protein Q8A67_011141 [Cirrhinus molitorella]|uniref:Uncharacterized protein n=1 Tax=Cirrhinus molitorella TaxID=172907 RepID=A0AA88PUF0_9TELE|nr:hypothetical protein Q8A67_011141 [Cirrhinus molitorella]
MRNRYVTENGEEHMVLCGISTCLWKSSYVLTSQLTLRNVFSALFSCRRSIHCFDRMVKGGFPYLAVCILPLAGRQGENLLFSAAKP